MHYAENTKSTSSAVILNTLMICHFTLLFTGRQHSSMLCRCLVLAIAKASVCPSVCLSVRHTLRFYQNDESQDHKIFTVGCVIRSGTLFSGGIRLMGIFARVLARSCRMPIVNSFSRHIFRTYNNQANVSIKAYNRNIQH